MAGQPSHVGNPLTLMAVFSGLSESVGAAVLPFADAAAQAKLVWFVMLFPTTLMALFFITLWSDAKLLYGARDLDTDEARLALLGVRQITERTQADAATERLQAFWKPGGAINGDNEAKLKKWLQENKIAVPLAVFIDGAAHAGDRERAVRELLS